MMKYLWSALNNAFFPEPLLDDYESAGWDLSDAVEIDTDVLTEFATSRPGKIRVVGNDKMPAWADLPPPTSDELAATAASMKSALIAEASRIIAPLKDASDGGYIDDADKPKLAAWQKYRYDLTKVDPIKPVWPLKPAE